MLVRYQENKGTELYAYRIREDLYPYSLYDTKGFSETDEFKEASSKMHKWNKVVKAAVLWVEKPIMVSCKVANTVEEKKIGLQKTPQLTDKEGMYFPYNPTADVTFHQGSVLYPLDIMFIRDDRIAQIETKTKVGSKDTWSCPSCDGVLEVIGGFCELNGINVGDEIALFGLTAQDLSEREAELKALRAKKARRPHKDDEEMYVPDCSLNLNSAIANSFLGY